MNMNENGFISKQTINTHHDYTWQSQGKLKLISDYDDKHLQSIFNTVLYKEMEIMTQLDNVNLTKEHVLHEANLRGIRLDWLDEIKENKNFSFVFRAERAIRGIMDVARIKYQKHKRDRHKAFKERKELINK